MDAHANLRQQAAYTRMRKRLAHDIQTCRHKLENLKKFPPLQRRKYLIA
jgi:hypothetical protein